MKSFLSSILLLSLAACTKHNSLRGEGATITEERALQPFTGVEANGEANVEIVPSIVNKAVVTGYGNLVPAYETRVSGSKLVLQFREQYVNVRDNNIRVTVYTTDLEYAGLHGSGSIRIGAGLPGSILTTELNGSGDIRVGAQSLQTVRHTINGSGSILAADAAGKTAQASISGSGRIEVKVTESLHADVSGSGEVHYWGGPALVDTDVSGSGQVVAH